MKIKAKLEPGKVAVVTGGSSGIGKAVACQLAERGMHVWLLAQRKEVLETARKEVENHRKSPNQTIDTISVDVTNLDQVSVAVRQILDKSGAIDLLVNSAGVTHPGYFQDLSIDIFKWMMDVNYFGTLFMTKEIIPAMIKRGTGYILNFSSGAGYIGYFGYTAYSASKFAVRGFSNALKQEMQYHGIGLSVIFPPDTDTPQLAYERKFMPDETRALNSAGGFFSPKTVARVALKGIERGQYIILPGFESKLYYRIIGLSDNLANFIIGQIISSVYKKKNSERRKKE